MLKSLLLGSAMVLALAACSSSQAPSAAVPPASATSAAAPSASAATPAAAASSAASVQSATAAAASTAAAGDTPVPPPADSGRWVEGKNYFRIEPAVPTDHPHHVVVTEVFSWGCPACNQFQPFADTIRASLPAYARWQYLPASFIPPEDWPTFQRAYFTAQAMGLDNPATHDAMFKAIWTPGAPLNTYDGLGTARPRVKQNLPTIADIARFYARHGADAKTFEATAQSFAVNARMKRADQLIKAYGVDSTPTLVINGKYRLNVASAGGLQQTRELVLYLAQKEAAAMQLKQ